MRAVAEARTPVRRGRRTAWAVLLGAGAAGALAVAAVGALTGATWAATRTALLVELAVLALCVLVLAAVHRARTSVLRLAAHLAPRTPHTPAPVPHREPDAPARRGASPRPTTTEV